MFHNKPIRLTFIAITLSCLSLTGQTWALRSDREKPIDIRADRVEISERDEISQYIGNVHLKQGSMNIKADKITVYLVKGKLHKIVIVGNPATFKQQPDDRKDIVHSSANTMEYIASKEHLVLKTNAQVIQGDNRFRGDFIEYDTLNSVVKAKKGEGSDSRVHAIIHPGNKDQADPESTKEQPKTVTPE
jgi:lipopolysaccharide export system protein LptA